MFLIKIEETRLVASSETTELVSASTSVSVFEEEL